jgi:hypothetical protein
MVCTYTDYTALVKTFRNPLQVLMLRVFEFQAPHFAFPRYQELFSARYVYLPTMAGYIVATIFWLEVKRHCMRSFNQSILPPMQSLYPLT